MRQQATEKMTKLQQIKKLISIAMIAIVPHSAFAIDEKKCWADMPSIKQDITEISTSKNYEVILKHTYPPLMMLFGGKAQYIEKIKETFQIFQNENVDIHVLSIGNPVDNILLSGKEICSIPIKMNIFSSNINVQSDNYIIAVRNFNTNEWKYVNGAEYFGPSILKSVFPHLPPNFQLPQTTIMPIL